MAIFNLPIGASKDIVQRIQLGRETHDFRFRWNSTEKSWYCYLGLNGDEPKVKFKLLSGLDLLEPYRAYEEVPNGHLFLIDIDVSQGKPSSDNLGQDKRFKLLYIEEGTDISNFI